MKIKKRITLLILMLALVLSSNIANLTYGEGGTITTNDEMRGLWVATVYNIDYPTKPTTDSEVLKKEALEILDKAASVGMNSVFLQIRPSSDALYKSDYFPYSKYLTGKQGTEPDNNFDPLEFWIKEAHKRNIELHAWINPYRISKKASSEKDFDYDLLDPKNPAKKNKSWVVEYKDGNLYYNPGLPEVRNMIVDSTLEVINNYDIDGIHLDDYFYPGTDFNDKDAFEKYGASYKDVNDFRRASVDKLITDLSVAIKNADPSISFGISPFGIWANKSSNPLGSDTNGMQSYSAHYADTRKWVKEEMIDYIAPQIYWNIGFEVADYEKLLKWWADVVKGTDVDLYIGQAAYRVGNTSSKSAWNGVSEIKKQLDMNKLYPEVDGSIFFKYTTFKQNSDLSSLVSNYYNGSYTNSTKKISNNLSVSISKPTSDISTYYDKFYIAGTYDPSKSFYLNGDKLEVTGGDMFYGTLVPLKIGKNEVKVSQDGSSDTILITRKTWTSSPLKTAAISKSSAFPESDEYRLSNEKITFECKAPIGASVSVEFNGNSYKLDPKTTYSPENGIYNTTYSYTYTIGKYEGTSKIYDLGSATYSMTYKGKSSSLKSNGSLKVLTQKAPIFATVKNDVINSYAAPKSSDGSAYDLKKGMTDYITGKTGRYTRLSSGLWVKNSDITEYKSNANLMTTITKATHSVDPSDSNIELVTIYLDKPALSYANLENGIVDLTIVNTSDNLLPKLNASTLIESINAISSSTKTVYSLNISKYSKLEGYYLDKYDDRIVLSLKKRKSVVNIDQPLTGITVMI
ncbi:MAG: family 10 glycosylhydrolase, partial [Acidaminobacteraceae bacterium]